MKNIYYLFILVFIIVSCTSNIREYENELLAQIGEIEHIVTLYDKDMKQMFDNGEYQKIAILSNETLKSIKLKFQNINNMKEPSSGKSLKLAGLAYVKELEKLIDNQIVYSTFTDSISVSEAQAMDEKNLNAAMQAEQAYLKLQEAQKKLY